MVVGIADDVLLGVLVLTGVVFVFQPQGNGKVAGQVVAHHFGGHNNTGRSIKHENLA